MKKKYIIHYRGLLSQGYVRVSIFGTKQMSIPFETESENFRWATKFRFKIIASMWCKIMNKVSKWNFDMNIYTVQKYR